MDSKIAEITRTPGSTKLNLKFQYDALGNRVAKHSFAANGIWRTSEFYVRDASGNIMATYKHYPQAQEMHYQLTERHIYGSARIGTENSCLELIANSTEIDIREFSRTINLKSYEISNHLGNVISTVSDLKIPVDISNDNLTDSYSAIIISATDYSPFGAALDKRSFNKEEYRFGFNGKELDNSTASDNYDFGARILDCRIGRWSSVDPLVAKYPFLSTFNYVSNNPLSFIDPDGKRIRPVGDAAQAAFEIMLSSIGENKQLAKIFNIYTSNSGAYGSYDNVAESLKSFKSRVRDSGLKMTKQELLDAYSVYRALQDKQEIQIEIVTGGGSDFTNGNSGSQGTIVKGTNQKLNANQGLQNMRDDMEQMGQADEQTIDEAVRPKNGAGTGKYKPNKIGENYAIYKSAPEIDKTNVGLKETVLVDGTGASIRQRATTIKKALTNEYPSE